MVVSNTSCRNGGQQSGNMIHPSGVQAFVLSSTTASAMCSFSIIDKITLKAVSKDIKTVTKMFQLRNVNPMKIQSYSSLANLIRNQLKDDITSEDFDVGYINGSNRISIQNKEDIVEVWNNVRKGVNVILWCDGLKHRAGSKRHLSNNDDNTPIVLRKKERVQQIFDVFKKQHMWREIYQYAVLLMGRDGQ